VLVWHFAQAVVVWAPVSANEDDACEKTAGFQAVIVWQDVHTAERPAWLGAAGVVWHAVQAAGVPRNTLVWQDAQAVEAWAPASLKVLDACEKVVGSHPLVVWQVVHTVDSPVWLMTAGVVWHDAQAAGVP
jgi:hypothetical protein